MRAYGEWWHYTARSSSRLGAEAFGEGTSRSSRMATSSQQPDFCTGSLRPTSPRGARCHATRSTRLSWPPSSQAGLVPAERASRGRQLSVDRGSEGGARWMRAAPPTCPAYAAGGRRRLRPACGLHRVGRLVDERRRRKHERRAAGSMLPNASRRRVSTTSRPSATPRSTSASSTTCAS